MGDANQEYEYSFRAWERDPTRRYVALAAMAAAGLAGMWLLRHPFFGLLGVGVVFVSTAELFLPVKYRLDESGARQKIGFSVTAITWTDVKRLVRQTDGVRLSPFDSPNRLDAFRGVFLPYAGNEDQVLSKISSLWQSDARLVGTASDSGSEGGVGGEGGAGRPQAQAGDPGDPLP